MFDEDEMQRRVEQVFGGILACDPDIYMEIKQDFCEKNGCEMAWLEQAINKINFEDFC